MRATLRRNRDISLILLLFVLVAFAYSAINPLHEATDAKKETIRVWIHEMPKENWGIAGVSAKDLGR